MSRLPVPGDPARPVLVTTACPTCAGTGTVGMGDDARRCRACGHGRLTVEERADRLARAYPRAEVRVVGGEVHVDLRDPGARDLEDSRRWAEAQRERDDAGARGWR